MSDQTEDGQDKGLSDHSSDRSSLTATKKLFRRMYEAEAGDQPSVPPLMFQYLESQKRVMKSRLMQGDADSTSEETDRDRASKPGSPNEDIPSAKDQYSDAIACGSGPNQSMVTPREFATDPFVMNRLVLARNALENIIEDEQINRNYQRKRRFLRMAYNLFHIDSMEEFCAAARIDDEMKVIKKYEDLLVRIDSTCNKWEKQKHEARLALKQQKRVEFAGAGLENVDSDVSTPCLSYESVSSDDDEEIFNKTTPYPTKAMYYLQRRENMYDPEWKFDYTSKNLSI